MTRKFLIIITIMINCYDTIKKTQRNYADAKVRGGLYSKGFNLVELMLVITIVGVLVAVALPSFNSTIQSMRVRTSADLITSSLYLARSEAIKQAGGITIQRTGGTWNTGWSIRDAAGNILRTVPATNGVTITHLSGAATVSVDRWGKFTGGGALAGSFGIVPSSTSSIARAVCVSIGGRISQKSNSATCP